MCVLTTKYIIVHNLVLKLVTFELIVIFVICQKPDIAFVKRYRIGFVIEWALNALMLHTNIGEIFKHCS